MTAEHIMGTERWRIFLPEPFPASAWTVLDERFELIHGRAGAAYAEDELIEQLQGVHGVAIYSRDRFSRRVLANAPQLRWIAKGGSKPSSNVDLEAAAERGIGVSWTPGANAVSVAEMTLALMLALARQLPRLSARLEGGGWRDFSLLGRELAGLTVGLIGLGAVGREVARRCAAFDPHVLAHDPQADADTARRLGVEVVALNELLSRSDVLSLHCELNASTVGLIGEAALAAMKDQAMLINTARGGLVDEAALRRALDSGKLAAAALDVFATEPPAPGHGLVGHPRVLATPHVAAFTQASIHRESARALEDLARALQGLPLRHAV